jgi:predicted RNA-binding Zn ribbon-like protein
MHTSERPSADRKQQRDEREPFVFLGGNLALDLVNTEMIVRGKKTDALVTPRDAAQWWEMARQAYPHLVQNQGGDWSEQQVTALRTLRRTLRQLFEALAAQRQIDEEQVNALNRVLREGYYALEISPEGNISATYKTRYDTSTAAELRIAFAALSLLMEQDLSRLHACHNEKCTLLFYDNTKSATRHWCSIACMNRARSRKNYRQAKEVPLPSIDPSDHFPERH